MLPVVWRVSFPSQKEGFKHILLQKILLTFKQTNTHTRTFRQLEVGATRSVRRMGKCPIISVVISMVRQFTWRVIQQPSWRIIMWCNINFRHWTASMAASGLHHHQNISNPSRKMPCWRQIRFSCWVGISMRVVWMLRWRWPSRASSRQTMRQVLRMQWMSCGCDGKWTQRHSHVSRSPSSRQCFIPCAEGGTSVSAWDDKLAADGVDNSFFFKRMNEQHPEYIYVVLCIQIKKKDKVIGESQNKFLFFFII